MWVSWPSSGSHVLSALLALTVLVPGSAAERLRDDLYDVSYYGDVSGVQSVIGRIGGLEARHQRLPPVDLDRRDATHNRTSLMICGMYEPEDVRVSSAGHDKMDDDCGQIAEMFHRAGADMRAVDKYGWDALHHGAVRGFTRFCEYLVSKAGLPVDSRDADGRTPLMKAGAHMFAATAEMLFSRGADYRLLDGEGRSAMHLAVQLAVLNTSYVPTLDRVTKTIPVDALDAHNRTLLHYALIGQGSLEAVRVLLANGADPGAVDAYGIRAMEMTRSEETRRLLAEANAAWAERQHQAWLLSERSAGEEL